MIFVWRKSMNMSQMQIETGLSQTGINKGGEGTVALYAAPNTFLLNKICLNQR